MEKEAICIGTPSILESDNVIEAPSNVNRPIPVPSVYKDSRGEIHNLLIAGEKRINILHTRKGVMRSGDLHANTQHDFIFKGKVEVWIREGDSTRKRIYEDKEYLKIDPYVPHIFHFLEDTIMAEWWEPEPFHAWYYEPYRKIVQDSFQSDEAEPGRFIRLVEEQS